MNKSDIVRLLILILLGALAVRVCLLVLDAVPFNADEAIVALMARHILQGEHTWFFYGQAYMGSLDAYLVAAAFAVMGQSVLTVRVVQLILFAGTLLTSYVVAHRFTGSRLAALLTSLLLAFPPVLLTLYTTVSLGGYGEALLIGNLLLGLGHHLHRKNPGRPWGWLAWGLIAGLGFWAFGLVLVYAMPVGLWLLCGLFLPPRQVVSRDRSHVLRGIARASRFALVPIGFALGSLPWWIGNLGQMRTGWAELLGAAVRSTATASTLLANVGSRVFNFFVLGLPALFGLRFPWTVEGPPVWLGVLPLALYLGSLGYAVWRCRRVTDDGVPLLGMWATLFLGFAGTPFGGDPTGRYFLPLYLPLFVFTAEAVTKAREQIGRWSWLLVAAVLIFNVVGTSQAAIRNPPGITTQFDPISQVDHRAYDELMRFLREQGETRGYANYWIAYPLAFLSEEEVILVPRLPYKADLRYTPRDNRYAPYDKVVDASPTAVYVTSNHPQLDRLLREQFAALGVTFREKQISSYHIFYSLSRKVTPEELSIQPKD